MTSGGDVQNLVTEVSVSVVQVCILSVMLECGIAQVRVDCAKIY